MHFVLFCFVGGWGSWGGGLLVFFNVFLGGLGGVLVLVFPLAKDIPAVRYEQIIHCL